VAQKAQTTSALTLLGALPPLKTMIRVGNMKFFIAFALLGTVFLSFLFGLWVYSNPQARKAKIDEYKEKILKKERRFWYNNKD
jgi:H+/Cl- antiporter ClcA